MKFITKTLAVFISIITGLNFAYAVEKKAGDNLASKQELLIAINGFNSLDPHRDRASRELLDFCEGLVTSNEKGEILPGVAESWSTKDNKTYVFNLRKNAKWYDGTPVTAEDFVFSFRRALDKNATDGRAINFFRKIFIKNSSAIADGYLPTEELGVKALNKHRLEIVLEKPTNYLLQALTNARALPVHRASIGAYTKGMDTKDKKLQAKLKETNLGYFVCNGAYKPTSYKDGVMIGERNKHYHNNSATVINKFSLIKSVSIADDADKFMQGKLHLTYRVPTERFWILEKESPDEVRSSRKLLINYFQTNAAKPPMNDPRVRQLISLAIDRNILTFAYLAQGHSPAYTFTPANTSGFNIPLPEFAKLTQKQRDIKARELLKQAGYGANNPLKFTITYVHSDRNIISYTAVTAIKKMLTETLKYVDVTIEPVKSRVYREKLKNRDYQLMRRGWNGNFNDAIAFLGLLLTEDGSLKTDYSNAKYDKIVEDAASTLDNKKRLKLYAEAEAIIAKDLPVIPLYRGGHSRMVSNKIGNFPYNDPHDRYYVKDLYVRTNSPSE